MHRFPIRGAAGSAIGARPVEPSSGGQVLAAAQPHLSANQRRRCPCVSTRQRPCWSSQSRAPQHHAIDARGDARRRTSPVCSNRRRALSGLSWSWVMVLSWARRPGEGNRQGPGVASRNARRHRGSRRVSMRSRVAGHSVYGVSLKSRSEGLLGPATCGGPSASGTSRCSERPGRREEPCRASPSRVAGQGCRSGGS